MQAAAIWDPPIGEPYVVVHEGRELSDHASWREAFDAAARLHLSTGKVYRVQIGAVVLGVCGWAGAAVQDVRAAQRENVRLLGHKMPRRPKKRRKRRWSW